MYSYYGEILNSTILDKNINCTIPCPILLKFMSSCPKREVNFFPPSLIDITEIIMVLLSCTPYPTCFLLLCLSFYFRTTRSILILLMVLGENFIVVSLKNIIREPRPNFLCNEEYGYPSNHSAFYTCILFWFIMDEILTPNHYQFKYKSYLIPFIFVYPFILYSRVYLRYHDANQIAGGFCLGLFIGIFWYLINIKFILPTDNIIRQLMVKFYVVNNLTDDTLFDEDNEGLIAKYQELVKKESELKSIKNQLKRITKNIGLINNLNVNFEHNLNNNMFNNMNESEKENFNDFANNYDFRRLVMINESDTENEDENIENDEKIVNSDGENNYYDINNENEDEGEYHNGYHSDPGEDGLHRLKKQKQD